LGTDLLSERSAKTQVLDCVTVKVFPAIVSVPVRSVVPEYEATVNTADPLPVPLAPDVTVIHATLLAAVHEQPEAAVIADDPVPPVDGTVEAAGEIENVQATAAWVTV
jgi:hypothetical protein